MFPRPCAVPHPPSAPLSTVVMPDSNLAPGGRARHGSGDRGSRSVGQLWDSKYNRQSPQKYLYVLSTKPIPSTSSPITIHALPLGSPPPFRMSSWEAPRPSFPPRISKLPTDVVSGIRAIHGTCTMPHPLALALCVFVVACDTVLQLGVPVSTVRGADCARACVYMYVRAGAHA